MAKKPKSVKQILDRIKTNRGVNSNVKPNTKMPTGGKRKKK